MSITLVKLVDKFILKYRNITTTISKSIFRQYIEIFKIKRCNEHKNKI